jgi:tetratricopeptide (TPR) repeat protein
MSEAKERPSRLAAGAAVIVLLTVVAYLPALRCGFVWDDDDHLTANPAMTAPHGLRMIWSSLAVSRYYPLTLTSFWVQRRLWDLNPLPYHAVNIALHAANAVLVFVLLRRLRAPGAWAAAALWALHPVCVESAAWVTELKNTQSGLFFFLALLCALHGDEQPGDRRVDALMLVCGVAAMLSKPSTVVLPAVLLLIVWWRRGRLRQQDWWRAAPLFLFALPMSVLTIMEQRWEVARGRQEVVPGWASRVPLAGKVLWFYLGKIFWPVDLMFIYPQWKLDPDSLMNWVPLIAAVAVGAGIWKIRRYDWSRACVLGLGYFALLLLPVAGLFHVYFFRYSFVADHFQYLACIGPIALAAGAGATVCRRVGQWGRYLGTLVVAVVLVVLGTASWRQELIYKDSETLWRDTVAKNPNSWLARNNLGAALASQGRRSEAMAEYAAALRLRPDYAEAHNNLGLALAGQGRLAEATAEYTAALRIKPDDSAAHNNLAVVLIRQGKAREAVQQCEQVLRIKPDSAEAQNNLAWLLATFTTADGGDPVRAVTLARRACELTGNRLAACLDTLAAAYAAAGRFSEAIATAQKAIELARSAGQPELASEIEARLQLYRAGRPYRQSAGGTSPHNP